MWKKVGRCSAGDEAATPSEITAPLSLAVAQLTYSSVSHQDQWPTSLEEDFVVSEILTRLTVKSLFKFKCVSTRYKDIISDPKFARNYLQRAYSSPESWFHSGLRASLLYPFTNLSSYPDGLSNNVKDFTDSIIDPTTQYCDDQDQLSIYVSTVSLPYHDDHKILGSSNGLVLSIFYPEFDGPRRSRRVTICVSNPLTKQSVRLPDPTETYYTILKFGIATRRDQATAAFLRYKIVTIKHFLRIVPPNSCANTTVEIFSSDTGSWSAWEVSCPGEIFSLWTKTGFDYRGILHWLDRSMGTIITYDPFDNPDRFDRIPLPNGRCSKSSLIFSGDEEMLKYCETEECGAGFERLLMWRLDKGEWCLEGKFEIPSLPYDCNLIMVAPNPWNRDVMCHPFVMYNKATNVKNQCTIMNPQAGRWELMNVLLDTIQAPVFSCTSISYSNGLVPIESCPWSSPLYVQA